MVAEQQNNCPLYWSCARAIKSKVSLTIQYTYPDFN